MMTRSRVALFHLFIILPILGSSLGFHLHPRGLRPSAVFISLPFNPLDGSTVALHAAAPALKNCFTSAEIIVVHSRTRSLRKLLKILSKVLRGYRLVVNGIAPLRNPYFRVVVRLYSRFKLTPYVYLHEGPSVLKKVETSNPGVMSVIEKLPLISCSAKTASQLEAELGLSVKHVVREVVPPLHLPAKDREIQRTVSRIVLSIGSVQSRKGVERFLAMAAWDLIQNPSPILWVWMGPLTSDTPKLVWPSNSIWIGPRRGYTFSLWVERSAAVVLFSREDPAPIAVSQALAAGKPCLVSEGVWLDDSLGLWRLERDDSIADCVDKTYRTMAHSCSEDIISFSRKHVQTPWDFAQQFEAIL